MSIEIFLTNSKEDINLYQNINLLLGTTDYNINNQSDILSYKISIKEFWLKTNINCFLSYQTLHKNINIFNGQLQLQ